MTNDPAAARRRHQAQYDIEKRLAAELLAADKERRRELYPRAYDQLFKLLPDHPQVQRKDDAAGRRQHLRSQLTILEAFARPDMTFVEVGAGDCALTCAMAARVKFAYAVETSNVITSDLACPDNFRLLLTGDCSIPLPAGTADLVYSNQLMEHLHPDDAREQLASIVGVLARGGQYVCVTPHRFNGPHDVSKFFDLTSAGLHLKEYTNTECARLFKAAGFRKVRVVYSLQGRVVRLPLLPVALVEGLLSLLPARVRRRVAFWRAMKILLGIKLVATK